ncbi:MAG: IPTL-CTERM sorting domain-containing protein [Burkholderiales bacterium]|nr:IPTL-CTERM sorting domain-containing protein [Burkholderiales bacterium]
MTKKKILGSLPLAVSIGLIGLAGAAWGAGGQTEAFCNTTAITIPVSGDQGVASLYPTTITASAMPPSVTKITVQLLGLSHTFPGDLDIMLVGPQGGQVILMSDVGGGTDISNVDLIFDDGAPSAPAAPITTGAYQPSNTGAGDPFPAPAPAGTPGTQLAGFNGSNPNGTWSLYIVDDAGADVGSMNGWCVNITSEIPSPTAVPTMSGLGLGLLSGLLALGAFWQRRRRG